MNIAFTPKPRMSKFLLKIQKSQGGPACRQGTPQQTSLPDDMLSWQGERYVPSNDLGFRICKYHERVKSFVIVARDEQAKV